MTTLTLQQRFAVAAAIGAAGGGVALAMIGQGKFGYGDAGFLRVASAGAFLAGLLVAGGFGGQGVPGLLRALLSFLGATVLGAVIAVLLMPFDSLWRQVLPLEILRDWVAGSLVGPLHVLEVLADDLLVLVVWAGGVAASRAAHLISRT